MSDISDRSDSEDSDTSSASSALPSEESSWDNEALEEDFASSPSSSSQHQHEESSNGSPVQQNGSMNNIDDDEEGSNGKSLSVFTIDYKLRPSSSDELKRSYRNIRAAFKAKAKQKRELYNKIEECKKQIDNFETFIPSVAAVWTNLDQTLIYLYKETMPEIEDFPELNHEVFGHLLGETSAQSLPAKLEASAETTQKILGLLSSNLKSIFALLIPVAKNLFKDEFLSMISNSPDLFKSLTGLSEDEILSSEELEEDQLAHIIMELAEKFRQSIDRRKADPKFRPSNDEKSSIKDKIKRLTEFARTVTPLLSDMRTINEWYLNYSKDEIEYEGEDIDSEEVKESLKKEDHLKALDEEIKDAEWEIDIAERKICRIKRIGVDLRQSNLLKNQIVDEDGNTMLETTQNEIDAVQQELNTANQEKEWLEEELVKIQESAKELQTLGEQFSKEEKFKESEIAQSPEILSMTPKIAQLALDLKLFKKECSRLTEYEQQFIACEKDIDDVAAKEEAEFDNTINQLIAEDAEHVEKLRIENEEMRKEADAMIPFPKTSEEFKKGVERAMSKFESAKSKMLKNAEKCEKLDSVIEDLELQLEQITSNFKNHIRIEFNDENIKDRELPPTHLQQDDFDLITAISEYNALKELEEINERPAEEQIRRCEELSVEVGRGFFEILRLKQAVTFLETESPENKRKMYTREVERRVRFSRHCLERSKDLLKVAKDACEVQTKSEDALGERYDLVQAWGRKIEKYAKAQEDKNQKSFGEFLQKLPNYKKRQAERDELVAEINAQNSQIKSAQNILDSFDAEFEELSKEFKAQNTVTVEEQYAQTVELQSEFNELTAEELELDILIQQEEKKIREIKEKKKEAVENEHRLERRLRKAEKKFRENKERADEQSKIEKYGSYDAMIKAETKRLKDVLTCSNCLQRDKNALITKCYHAFCYECIDNLVKARNRKCPKCKIGFGSTDYRRIFMGDKVSSSS